MKKLLLIALLSIQLCKADTTGCYVLYSDPNHCYEVTTEYTDIPKDILTFTPGDFYAKYGLLLGSVLNKSVILVQEYNKEIIRLNNKIRRLKSVCGAKCNKVK